jgi:predicted alpha/beta-hydrolase family hydrolase
VLLGGQSYGGRQASLLAADEPGLAEALVLFSYPLHPPGKPERVRAEHFARIAAPCLFVHGTSDPFGSLPEVEAAIALISAPTRLIAVAGAGHDLKGGRFDLAAVAAAALELVG